MTTRKSVAPARAATEKGARTREELLVATERVVDEDGRDAVTTTRVAEVAGVSVSVVYDHFRNKEALLDAIERRSAEVVVPALLARVTRPEPTYEHVARLIDDLVGTAVDLLVPRVRYHATNVADDSTYDVVVDALLPHVLALNDFLRLEDPRFTLTLVVKLGATAIWFGHHDHPDEAVNGKLRRELVILSTAMILRHVHRVADGKVT
jgi:AcrR family transcriptional regulator